MKKSAEKGPALKIVLDDKMIAAACEAYVGNRINKEVEQAFATVPATYTVTVLVGAKVVKRVRKQRQPKPVMGNAIS